MMECAYEAEGFDTGSTRKWRADTRAEIFSFRRDLLCISVLLVDDYEVVRTSCRLALENAPDIRVVAEAGDGYAGCARYKECRPDVVLLDINMPGIDGIETTRRIKAHDSGACILIFSSHTDAGIIRRALEAGATGYLDKRDGLQMAEVIRKAVRGEMSWT